MQALVYGHSHLESSQVTVKLKERKKANQTRNRAPPLHAHFAEAHHGHATQYLSLKASQRTKHA